MAHASTYRFLDPAVLAALKDLPLLAKTVVDGFMLGPHHSRHAGVGLEFNQYRSYQPGDDPRHIDWQLYARSDRYFVREAEVETNITVRLLLDASASMAHEDQGRSKFDYARMLVAALGYLAHQQGDALSLLTFRAGQADLLPARRTPQHLHQFFHTLDQTTPLGRWPDRLTVGDLAVTLQGRGMVILVTDCYEVNGEILHLLEMLRALRHEVLVFHLVSPNEQDLRFDGPVTVEDLETGERLHVDHLESGTAYKTDYAAHLTHIQTHLAARDIEYTLLQTSAPLDRALQQFLARRQRR